MALPSLSGFSTFRRSCLMTDRRLQHGEGSQRSIDLPQARS